MSVRLEAILSQIPEVKYPQTALQQYCTFLLNLTPRTCPESPPIRIMPTTFEEIQAMREEIALLRVGIYRPDQAQQYYLQGQSQQGDARQRVLDQYFSGVSFECEDQRVVIDRDPYPAEMPKAQWPFTEVAHFNFWFPNEDLPMPCLADVIAGWCTVNQINSDDFVLWKKPPATATYVKGLTRSVSLPHGHIVARLKGHDFSSS